MESAAMTYLSTTASSVAADCATAIGYGLVIFASIVGIRYVIKALKAAAH